MKARTGRFTKVLNRSSVENFEGTFKYFLSAFATFCHVKGGEFKPWKYDFGSMKLEVLQISFVAHKFSDYLFQLRFFFIGGKSKGGEIKNSIKYS